MSSSLRMTGESLARIAAADPAVNAVLALDRTALDQATSADERHAAGRRLGPLDGVPVLIKDNVDTAGLASTAGSRLLAGVPPRRDAEVVARLRAAGAVIVGKTNLSEWGNFRSAHAVEGWSAMGGQTRNPYALDRSPWGSSSGSAVAVATGMVPLAIGTETDGSIVGPAGMNGVAGIKPETGLLPLDGIVPISRNQDTAGPIARTLAQAVTCLEVLTGLSFSALPPAECRFGVWQPEGMPEVPVAVLDALKAAGAEVVPVRLEVTRQLAFGGTMGLYADLRPSLEAYLRTRDNVPSTLRELIEAAERDPVELSLFGQDLFEQVAAMSEDDLDMAALAGGQARTQARDLLGHTLAEHGVHAVLAPSNVPAWLISHGDPHPVPTSSTLPALAGYPNVSIPAGLADGLPVGVSVFGPSTVAALLPVALAVESVRRQPAVSAVDQHHLDVPVPEGVWL